MFTASTLYAVAAQSCECSECSAVAKAGLYDQSDMVGKAWRPGGRARAEQRDHSADLTVSASWSVGNCKQRTISVLSAGASKQSHCGRLPILEGKTHEIRKPGAMSAKEEEPIKTLDVSRIEHVSGSFCETGIR